MENPPSDCRKAIQELERGRELATELWRLIQNSNGGGHDDKTTPLAVDLSEKVVTTFSNSLLLLNLCTHESQMQRLSSSSVPAKSDDSEDSCKSTSAVKERRGCHKRRRISHTSVKDSEAPIADDYAWRKYGQKIIMNNKYPRNYYRCTHKFEQGCLATKQVQRIQEEPVLYRTTYYGPHTCKRNLLDNEIILDSNSPSQSSILLSFDKQAFFSSSSSSSLPLTKKLCKEEVPSSSSEDYLLAPELITLSSTLESNHGDPISDMLYDHVLESFDF